MSWGRDGHAPAMMGKDYTAVKKDLESLRKEIVAIKRKIGIGRKKAKGRRAAGRKK